MLRALDPTTGPVADPMVAIAALRERLSLPDSLAANVPKWDRGRTPYWQAAILAELADRAEAVRLLTVAPSQGS